MGLLIIGASGGIGRKLFEACKNKEKITATYFSNQRFKDLTYFDIIDSDVHNIMDFSESRKAVICCGITSVSQCIQYYSRAYSVNVMGIKKLVRELCENQYHIVFLSSSYVFDGVKGFYSETDVTNPVNAYGEMKKEVEEFIMRDYPESCILRLGKVYGGGMNDIFLKWVKCARENRPIHCVKGNRLSFVSMEDAVSAIQMALDLQLSGIYHIGGWCTGESRIQLCRKFLGSIGLKTEIYEVDVDELGLVDGFPLDTSLCSKKITEKGLAFRGSIEECFDRYRTICRE